MSRRSNEVMSNLKAALELALPSFTITQGDSSGDPTLDISEDSTPAAGEEVAFIKIIQRAYVGFPTPSLASADDGRNHVLQLVLEESGTSGISVWSSINLAKLLARVKTDTTMDAELYIRANSSLPVEGDITSGNLVGDIPNDIRHPNAGQ